MVAHALKVHDDVEDRCDGPQVAREWLLCGDQFEAGLLDLVTLIVDLGVIRDDLLGQIRVTLAERRDASLQRRLYAESEPDHVFLDLF